MECGSNVTPGDIERSYQEKMIKEKLSNIGKKILVMSGKGGVGKSTIASYLALSLADKGYKVGLLDVDLHGPSIPRMLNVKGGFEMPEKDIIKPYAFSENLKIVSVEMILDDKDTAIIWRGPLKIGAINQFIGDLDWGTLDYLVIDSPPGTGDEPLTVAQTITDAEAIIITTPQEVSLADVRKSINFCHQVKINIIGLIENMSEYICPHCGGKSAIFGTGGGAKMATQMDIPFLGTIPIDPKVVELADQGRLDTMLDQTDNVVNKVFEAIINKIIT